MPTPSFHRRLTAPFALLIVLLLSSCGGGSGGSNGSNGGVTPPVSTPLPTPVGTTPSRLTAQQACIKDSPYTITLVNSEQIPNDTIERMVCTFAEVYPKAAALLSNPDAPKSVVFEFQANYRYPAANTNYNTITYDITWMKEHPLDSDIVVHEAVHVVQAGRGQVPSWVLEGTADYVRDLYGLRNFENGWSIPVRYDGISYTNGYGSAAAFIKWVDAMYRQGQPRMVEAIYKSANTQPYQDNLWVELTGKSVETLWSEYRNQPVATPVTSGVGVFMAPNYKSYGVKLERGHYDLADLLSRAIPDNEIASLQVPAGYKVTAFADVGFKGERIELSADAPTLPAAMTRRISSLWIE